jgi:plastocyanin
MRTRHLLLAFSMVVVVAACGGDDDAGSDATDAAATDATSAAAGSDAGLTIQGSAFSPQELTAPAGTIEITNQDGMTHTVTADDGAFDVSVDGGATASITVDTPGSYPFHCNIHSFMTGTLIIT